MSGSPLMAACGGIAGQRERAVGHGILNAGAQAICSLPDGQAPRTRAGPVDQRVVSFFAQPQNTSSGLPALPESDCDEKDEAGAHRQAEGPRSLFGRPGGPTRTRNGQRIAGAARRGRNAWSRRALDRQAERAGEGAQALIPRADPVCGRHLLNEQGVDRYLGLDVRWLARSVLPFGLAKKKWLCWYASEFRPPKSNGSSHCTPSLEEVATWRDQTPRSSKFAWKASKFITHWRPVRIARTRSQSRTRYRGLSPTSLPLFQLPPQFSKNRERLASFLDMLPRCYPYAFEFRHTSWYEDDIYEILRAHDVSLAFPIITTRRRRGKCDRSSRLSARTRAHGRYKDHYRQTSVAHLGASHRQLAEPAAHGVRLFRQHQKSAAPTVAPGRLCELLQQAGR